MAGLLDFVRLGLEEEALHQLRAPVGGKPPMAATLPGTTEQILHEQFNNLVLGADHPLAPMLQNNKNAKLCYGYPLLAKGDGTVWPLFVMKMRVDEGGGGFVTQVEPWNHLRLNLGLLRHLGLEETAIAEMAEVALDPNREFAERLADVAQRLDLPADRFPARDLQPAPEDVETAPEDGWVNCPMLFVIALPPHRRALSAELAGLGQPSKRALVGESALQILTGAPETAGETPENEGEAEGKPEPPPLVFEVHASGPSQSAAIRSSLKHPCTLVTAPPGTGQVATVLNLIATSVLREESVLYVSPLRASVDQTVRHVEALIGKDLPFAMRIGAGLENAERGQQQRDALFELAKADNSAEPEQKSKRDKPTIRGLRELEQAAPDTEGGAQKLREAHRAVAEACVALRAMSLTQGPNWAGRQAAKMNPSFDRETLSDWRDEIEAIAGNKTHGVGTRVMNLLSRADPKAELIREIKTAYSRLPKEVHAPIIKKIDEDEGLSALREAVDLLDTFLDWRDLVKARLEAIRKLVRLSDSRTLELQQLNYTSSKTAAARELFRDHWQERLTNNIPLLDKQIDTFSDLLTRESTGDPKQEQQHALKLTRAISVLSKTLPVWVSTVDAAIASLPAQPGLFDLVIVDDADQVELAAMLPMLFRAKRAMVIGAGHRNGPSSSASLVNLPLVQKAAAALPAWCRDPLTKALPALDGALEGSDRLCELADHFRSHPLVADYLNRTFYEARMRIRTNVRTMTTGLSRAHVGVHWHSAIGRVAPPRDKEPEVNLGEVEACVALLKRWLKDKLFSAAPRRSFGVVSAIPFQHAALRDRLKAEMFPLKELKRLHIGPPKMFAGKQVDFLIVMPGPAQSGPPGHNAELGQHAGLYHDAIAACRIGLHVVGDHQACRMAGGFAAALVEHIGPPPQVDETADDATDAEFEAAFGRLEEVAPDLMEPLCRLLDAAGYAYQCGVEEHGQMLAVRLLSPHGGRYNLEFERPLVEIGSADELELDQARDAEVSRHGYEVVRVSPEDVLEKADMIVERLARLA
ncbi:MAG: hypothetical protein RIM84_24070 [Alphaproteobacteria bacterium]